MASVLRPVRKVRPLVFNGPAPRYLHQTPAVWKKRSKAANTFAADAFSDDLEADELFPSKKPGSSSKQAALPSSATVVHQTPHVGPVRAQPSVLAAERFERHYAFMAARVGAHPQEKHPLMRPNALSALLHYAFTKAQLERVASLLVEWRNGGRAVDAQTVETLIDRCVKRHPTLLVRVFADRPAYGLDLLGIHAARRILRALVHARAPDTDAAAAAADALQHAAAFAALYPLYGLPPAHTDLTSCALLAAACARAAGAPGGESGEGENDEGKISGSASSGAPGASVALDALLPGLLRQVAADVPAPVGTPSPVLARRVGGATQPTAVEWTWVTAGLRSVRGALKRLERGEGRQLAAVREALLARRPAEGRWVA